jgi:hypothetical protein
MSDALGERGSELVAEADKVRGDLGPAYDRVRTRRDLSDDTKREQLGQLYDRACERIDELGSSYRQLGDDALRKARSQVFEPPVRVTASPEERVAVRADYRQALERAAAMKGPLDVTDLAGRAILVGDEALARATLVVAFEHGWGNAALLALGDAHPDLVTAARRLTEVEAQVGSSRARGVAALAFARPSPPREAARAAPLWRTTAG